MKKDALDRLIALSPASSFFYVSLSSVLHPSSFILLLVPLSLGPAIMVIS